MPPPVVRSNDLDSDANLTSKKCLELRTKHHVGIVFDVAEATCRCERVVEGLQRERRRWGVTGWQGYGEFLLQACTEAPGTRAALPSTTRHACHMSMVGERFLGQASPPTGPRNIPGDVPRPGDGAARQPRSRSAAMRVDATKAALQSAEQGRVRETSIMRVDPTDRPPFCSRDFLPQTPPGWMQLVLGCLAKDVANSWEVSGWMLLIPLVHGRS